MTINKILIAIDNSKHAEHAATFGFELARSYKAEVGLVSIVEPIVYPVSGAGSMTGIPMEGPNVDEVEMLRIQTESAENMMQQTKKKFADGLKVTYFTEYGLTADSILKCGSEFNADLIVVGTHSRTGFDRFFMGSVAEHVVRHSHVPVVVVPLKEES
ncbi:MAG: putative universal stress protein [Mucilaginibacter sp.]|nr:putative universal stress protein [Mucilaginibacter sp.]